MHPRQLPPLLPLLALSLVLTGCADTTGPGDDTGASTTADEAGLTSADIGSAGPGTEQAVVSEPPPDTPVDPAVLARHDGSRVSGLATGIVSDQEHQIHLTWPAVPGADHLSHHLSEQAEALAAGFRAEHPVPDGEAVDVLARPELNRTWSLAGYSPEMIGVLHEGYVFEGASTAQTWSSTWWDPQTGEVVPPIDLIADARRADFGARVTDLVTRHHPGTVLPEELQGKLSGTGPPVVAFTPDGDLAVGFDAYSVAVGSAGPVLVTVPAAEADPLLSDEGRQAKEAATRPTDPRLAPAVQPSPTRPSVPAPTDPPAPATTEATGGATPTDEPEPSTPAPAPSGRVDCAVASCVAITFDDGPAASTEAVMAAFAARGQRATFFVLGQQVRTYPGVMQRMAAGGHEVGVHTWDHPSLPRLGPDQIRSQLASTATAIRDAGGGRPRVFRPPYGATSDTVVSIGRDLGLQQTLWDIDTLDWRDRDAAVVTRRVLEQARRGSVVLMHDIHPSTAQAAPAIVDGLLDRGFTLVTVSELTAGGR